MATVNVKTTEKKVMVPKVVTKKVVTLELSEEEAVVLCSLTGSVMGPTPERTLADRVYHSLRDAGVGYLRTHTGEDAVSATRFSRNTLRVQGGLDTPAVEWNPVIE